VYVRTKQGGTRHSPHSYLQIVEGYRQNGRVKQRVVANLGRLDELVSGGDLDGLITSLARFSKRLKILDLTRDPDVTQCADKLWGPILVFRRLWDEQGLPQIIRQLAAGSQFRFDLERICFALAVQRLIQPGSDLAGERWMQSVAGLEGIPRHQLYRTCRFLAGNKARIEQELAARKRTLFDDEAVDLVFFDTTSTCFEGGESPLRRYGHSKDHRPDRVQIVVGVIMSRAGWPLACEVYRGNQADVKLVEPLIKLARERLNLGRVILVLDRGFTSRGNLAAIVKSGLDYIVGARLRRDKVIRAEVLTDTGPYQDVNENLKVKEVKVTGKRYIVCLNPEEAIRDEADRVKMLAELKERLDQRRGKSLVGNRGYARYLQVKPDGMELNAAAAEREKQFDGIYVLETNTALGTVEAAQAYKNLWQVEQAFRDLKSPLELRPIFHRSDANVIGHVFGAFLGLRLKIALQQRVGKAGLKLPWNQVLTDLSSLKAVHIRLDGTDYTVRTDLQGDCYKILQAVGVKPPPRIKSENQDPMLCHDHT
jgi:hypothetical protein